MSKALAPPNSTVVSRFTRQETESGPNSPWSLMGPLYGGSAPGMLVEEVPDLQGRVHQVRGHADHGDGQVLLATRPGVAAVLDGEELDLGAAPAPVVRGAPDRGGGPDRTGDGGGELGLPAPVELRPVGGA